MNRVLIVGFVLLGSLHTAQVLSAQALESNESSSANLRGTKASPLIVDLRSTPSDPRGTKDLPLLIETVESNSDMIEKREAREHRGLEATNSRWTMIFTVVMTVVASLQAVMFAFQLLFMRKSLEDSSLAAKAARDTADLARQEFAATHRPRVVVRREDLRYTSEQKGINLVLANTGASTASNITADLNVRILPIGDSSLEKESMPPYSGNQMDISAIYATQGMTPDLKAGERKFFFFMQNLEQAEWEAIQDQQKILYFFGNVTFADSSGIKRDTAFFRTYHPVSKRFFSTNDPDYEYN